MIHTIIQIIIFQFLFLAVYDLFLKKETFFSLNRGYLLLTPVLSIVLPFISLGFIQQNIPQGAVVQLPALILGDAVLETGNGPILGLSNIEILWILGVIGSVLLFSYKIFKLKKLKTLGTTETIRETRLIILPKTDIAFSFFNTIYLGENISEEKKVSIVAHENIHIQQKHSLDLLYFELLRIVFWFNPLVYVFQNRIATLHEYIADAEMTHYGKKQYYQNLLSEVFQTKEISFLNTFFNQSLIKKRILMLQKPKSSKTAQLRYFLLVPLLFGMVVYTSCNNDPKPDENQTEQLSEDEMMDKIIADEEEKMRLYQENTIVQVDSIIDNNEIKDVPFSVIEQVPTYPGCSGDNYAMKKCMSTKIAEFVNSNFNVGLANDLKLSGRQRIAVQFKIDKTGKVVDVRARAPKRELELEAVRVVKMLPQMIPGEQKGNKVGVLYSLPIIFNAE